MATLFPGLDAYWTLDAAQVTTRLASGPEGLSPAEAASRLARCGPNQLRARQRFSKGRVLFAQIKSPLLLLLVFAAGASALSGEWVDASIVLTILLASVSIGFQREYRAHEAVEALQATVHTRARVVRGGQTLGVPIEEVVPGDVVLLSAGSMVPGDGVVLEEADLFVSEAALTGESFPVEKEAGVAPLAAPLGARTNCVFLGTSVRSGTARCMVVSTGQATAFGAAAGRLAERAPETEFDRGLRRFGYLLTIAMLSLVILVFTAHMLQGRPPIETLLFSVALAVGLSPELLPAILSVNLARGAQVMATRGVIVRRLNAIENLGSMDVLCTDKTGTLTEGVIRLEGAYNPSGAPSGEVLALGAVNAALASGMPSPLDDAVLESQRPDMSSLRKVGEIPFDFIRKRVSIGVERGGARQVVAKGAFEPMLAACVRLPGGRPLDDAERTRIRERYQAWGRQGVRVLAVGVRPLDENQILDRDTDRDLTFTGFLTFLDRPEEGAREALADMKALGVAVKIISGDSALVVQYIAGLVGLRAGRVLTGRALHDLSDDALGHAVDHVDLFAEVEPNQKERIILALKKRGHAVGFLGDGINDAPAMHAADTSLSVQHAADVAREAADFVLLEHNLDVIRGGIEEGRRTFANTMKYVLTTTSANLGNMLSMAAASLVLPFLPLLAGQILLNNFLSDIPAVGIADDSVDPEMLARPERWDMRYIARFMVSFGALSSLFDALTFVTLLGVFHAMPDLFRTAWFVESLLTELVIALVVRTRRPFYRSRPGRLLFVLTIVVAIVALAIPYLPDVALLGFVPLPLPLAGAVCAITALYVLATELLKHWFFRGAAILTPAAPL